MIEDIDSINVGDYMLITGDLKASADTCGYVDQMKLSKLDANPLKVVEKGHNKTENVFLSDGIWYNIKDLTRLISLRTKDDGSIGNQILMF